MSLSLIALAAVAAASHTVQIDHGGHAVQAVYSARTEISTRTVGAATPNRMDGRRCKWSATILIDRQLQHTPALARTIVADRTLSGSQPGACTGNRKIIDREVALRADTVRESLITSAEQDRAPLLAELDAVRNLAAN